MTHKPDGPSHNVLSVAPRGGQNASIFYIFNEIRDILGTTKSFIWPGFEATGNEIKGFAPTVLNPQDETGNVALETEFKPIFDMREIGIHGYYFSGDNNRHFVAADNAEYSFEADAEPFSLGIWALPMEGGSALQALMAKYDEGVATEYSLHVTSGDVLQLDLFDGIDGATGKLRYTAVKATVDLYQLRFYVMVYAGNEGVVKFYKDGILVETITAVETSAYANMDDTAAKFFVGGRDDGGVPDDLFQGWLALPQGSQKALSEAEVRDLYSLQRDLLGV
ncbi:hypothetical protein LCGC14_2056830 [marine sediment metagenome]|uniref:LamG-like jellyroll fold domain-containing protein n=1 Tax=marine sediment metagenome TaxID=412755 RepID=A0A0F9EME5_9ZZZZ